MTNRLHKPRSHSARHQHELTLAIRGMHCANCAVLIERQLKTVPGVRSVNVSYRSGKARIKHHGELNIATLQKAVAEDGYTITPLHERDDVAPGESTNTARDYVEIGAAFLILVGIVFALQQLQLLPRGLTVSDDMSYALVFAIGLVASVSSCIAVTGGLLVAAAAKYNTAHASLSDVQRLTPHIYFNVGRIVSYTLLGGAVGALGSTLTLTPEVNGFLTILASAVMIVLGLQMLRLFPSLGRLMPTMPKFIAHRIHDFSARETRDAAFLLGASTFFLPCGFTQALQLYVLAKGSVMTGALTMLAFSLGTLPALLSLSALSSFAKGAFQNRFLKLAGVAVIMLGFWNIQYGLVLASTGGTASASVSSVKPSTAKSKSAATEQLSQTTDQGALEPQKIAMRVIEYDYAPNQFTVTQGVPVEWWIDGREAAGCGRVLFAPRLGIRKVLSRGSFTLITFTPEQTGDFAFNCGMGMMTPNSKITVVSKAKG